MSQRTSPRRVVLEDFKAKKEVEGAVDIVAGDRTFRITPPQLLPDAALKMDANADPVGFAAIVLGGQENYDAFVERGGSAAMLLAIFQEEVGEPGESEASSSS